MSKIFELIEIPEVKTVIELASVRETEAPQGDAARLLQEIAQTFVVTDDIKMNLDSIFSSVIKNEGRGFFLSGSFGSGKSHFLATLSLLMTYPEAWQPLTVQEPALEIYENDIQQKRFAVVQIPLLEFSAKESLELIIFRAIEKTLNYRWGFDLTLSEDEYFLEMFERYVLPTCRKEVNAFIQEEIGSQFNWQALRSETQDLVRLSQKFLQTRPEEIPFHLNPQRRQAVEKMIDELDSRNFSGILILLDELSEFLKSKSTQAELNEDARFLQFLGESSLNYPIWIVGALQEAIEKTGDIQKSVFDKIKDRYRTRLELSTRHIRELIERRLVIKKDSAASALKEAYAILKNSFNNIRITEDVFFQIYPVHPECLEILDLSEGLFSQRRGVVDFIHYQLKGDPTRHISGMLDSDYLELLTPDKIFDHFYVQIKENPQTNKYFTIFRDHFKKKVPELFDSPGDADCALKAIKILILLEILPVKQQRTVQELANMILYRSTDLSLSDINYEYFEENILKRLEGELGFLKIEKSNEKYQDIYRFDIALTARDVIAERIKAYQMAVKGKHRELVEEIFPAIQSPIFPWGQILNVESHRNYIKWMNSVREGRVILSDLRDFDAPAIARLVNRLETTEDDFFVIFGFPFGQTEQLNFFKSANGGDSMSRFRQGIIIVLPTSFSDTDWDTLELCYATSMALEDYANDDSAEALEIKERLKQDITKLERESRTILDAAYTDGLIYTMKGQLNQRVRELTDPNFDAILTRIIAKPLESIYPLFNTIAPLDEISSYTILKELLTQFIQPGMIEDLNHPQYRVLRHAIDNIATPMGIAEIKGRKCLLQGDTKVSTGLNAIYELVDATQPVGYHELYIQLRNSEYGMTRFIFDLLLMVLLRKGHLVGRHGEQSVSFYQLQFPLFKYLDFVVRGQLIPMELREKLMVIARSLLKEDASNYDIEKQENIWAKLREFQEKAGSFLEKVRLQLQLLRVKYKVDDADIKFTLNALKTVEQVAKGINRSLSSKAGLEKLLNSIEKPDQLHYSLEQMRVINRFFEKGYQEFEQIFGYMNHPQLAIPNDKDFEDLLALQARILSKLKINDNLMLEDGLNYLKGLFKDFLDIYKGRYTQEHDWRNRAIDLDQLTSLENSSEFQALRQLSQINLISVPDDYLRIKKQIDDLKQQVCSLSVADTLDHYPQCRCGFALGTKIEKLDPAPIQDAIERGIQQYLNALQETDFRGQLELYLENMDKINRTVPGEEIKSLLAMSPKTGVAEVLPQLEENLKSSVISTVNKAFTGDVVIIPRNLDELYESLIDRKYTPEKIMQIVNAWLAGEEGKVDPKAYIEIISKK